MTPILIVIQPEGQIPQVYWASDTHVIASSTRLDDVDPLNFEEAWERYVDRHDEARWFASQEEARLWAGSYEGDSWLMIRAEIAKAGNEPPNDLASG